MNNDSNTDDFFTSNNVLIRGNMRYVVLGDENIDAEYPIHVFLFYANQKVGIVDSFLNIDDAMEKCKELNETLLM